MDLHFLERFSKYPQISNLVEIRPVGDEQFHEATRHDEVNGRIAQFCERAYTVWRWCSTTSVSVKCTCSSQTTLCDMFKYKVRSSITVWSCSHPAVPSTIAQWRLVDIMYSEHRAAATHSVLLFAKHHHTVNNLTTVDTSTGSLTCYKLTYRHVSHSLTKSSFTTRIRRVTVSFGTYAHFTLRTERPWTSQHPRRPTLV